MPARPRARESTRAGCSRRRWRTCASPARARWTAGTHVFDPVPISQDGYAELAAAATVPKGRFDVEFLNADQPAFPLVLAPNEGLCIRNTVLMGAGGAVRLTVEVDWFELNNHS